MNILPYTLETTNDLLTSRAGLLSIAQLMQSIGFPDWVDRYFPAPKSNRGFPPSTFVNAVMLMLHEGGRCLDDLRHLREDQALRTLLGLTQIPESDSLGDWLRRHGQQGVAALTNVNRELLACSLHHCSRVTLDIDATLSASKNKQAQWTYQKCTGYMPMVGHIAETGQVVATDFRDGNVSPSTNNLAFIHQCEAALPAGVSLAALRIDAAGYQVAIIDECIDRQLKFAIRVKMSAALKQQIRAQAESQWQPLVDRQGNDAEAESTTRFIHTMQKSCHSFTVIVQRRQITGQQTLAIDDNEVQELMQSGQYIYRAIAVSEDNTLSDSDWVHWYNQRGEHSENRIKELKCDFAADRMPCQDFAANALYFSLCTLAFNLLALMRMHLPPRFESCRAKTIRWRLYGLAGKIVRHGRKVYLKVSAAHQRLLQEILWPLQHLAQAP